MATQFPRVKPGEVIQAQHWNSVVDAVETLLAQVGVGNSQNVVINGFLPPGPAVVGSLLTIQGQNFDFSVGATRLFFDGAQVSTFTLGSSDNQLVVNVPDPGNLPAQGRSVTVTVYNRYGNTQKQLTVLPIPVPLNGSVTVSPTPFTGSATIAPPPTNFPFTLSSGLSVSRTLVLTPTVNVQASGVNPQAWQNAVQILDSNLQPIQAGQVTLVPNQSMTVFVSVAIPSTLPGTSTSTNGTNFNVKLDAIDALTAANLGGSGAKTYVVGQASQDDPNIQFGLVAVGPVIPSQGNPQSGNTIKLVPNSTALVQVTTTFKVPTKYTVSVTPTNASGWTATLVAPQPSSSSDPTTGVLDFSAGVQPPVPVQFKLQTNGSPTSGGTLVFKAQQSSGTTLSDSLVFNLQAG
jgi:hypothetical protein